MMKQKPSGKPHRSGTLHTALAALERHLNTQANRLEKRRCSTNNATHWKARGGQQALDLAVKHLRRMRHEHRSLKALHQALSGYVLCLEKTCGDAQQESTRPVPKRGSMPIEQWKAEGEHLVLVPTCTRIVTLLQVYAPAEAVQLHLHLDTGAANEMQVELQAC